MVLVKDRIDLPILTDRGGESCQVGRRYLFGLVQPIGDRGYLLDCAVLPLFITFCVQSESTKVFRGAAMKLVDGKRCHTVLLGAETLNQG